MTIAVTFRVAFFLGMAIVALSWPVYAGNHRDNLQCSSYEAVYVPSVSKDFEGKSRYSYRLTVQKIKQKGIDDPYARFVIETASKDQKKILSKMKMDIFCSKGISCEIGYEDKNAKKLQTSIVYALTKDLTPSNYVATFPVSNEVQYAPYLLIFPELSQRFFYIPWDHTDIPNIEYLTEERVHPEGIEVWRLNECLEPK